MSSSLYMTVMTRKGRWSTQEHEKFLVLLEEVGIGNWTLMHQLMPRRKPSQIRSHAQKHFLRKPFSTEEDQSLQEAVASVTDKRNVPVSSFGINEWGRVARCVGNRTGESCKKRYFQLHHPAGTAKPIKTVSNQRMKESSRTRGKQQKRKTEESSPIVKTQSKRPKNIGVVSTGKYCAVYQNHIDVLNIPLPLTPRGVMVISFN